MLIQDHIQLNYLFYTAMYILLPHSGTIHLLSTQDYDNNQGKYKKNKETHKHITNKYCHVFRFIRTSTDLHALIEK